MAFTNIWVDNEPLATSSASLGYLDMQNIRVDVSERLAQALCGVKSARPTTLEAFFTAGANAGMPYYATDEHKTYQLIAAGAYAEVACQAQLFIDTTVNTYNLTSGTVTLNTVTIPAGFLGTPPYYIEIENRVQFTTIGSLPVALISFGGTPFISAAANANNTIIAIKLKVYVPSAGVQKIVGDVMSPGPTGNSLVGVELPQTGAVDTTGAITILSQASGTGIGVKGSWLTCRIWK